MSDINMVFGSIKQLAQEEEIEQRRLLGIWEVDDSKVSNVYSDYESHELKQGEDLRGFLLRTNRYNSFLSGLEQHFAGDRISYWIIFGRTESRKVSVPFTIRVSLVYDPLRGHSSTVPSGLSEP